MAFVKAERKKAKLRLALTGPSGSGKTYGALLIAKGLGGRIAAIDTERGSAALYAHLVDFDTMEMGAPYTPEKFIEAIHDAERGGYSTLIIDSLSHEWNGVGGCLELVDEVARARFKGNTWSAWNEVTPRHRKLLDTIIQSPLHIIATTRSKTETAQTEGPNGRKQVVKLGMKSEQRDGFEYEFTTVLDIVHDGHYAVASKDRTGLFAGADPERITPATGAKLLEWLETGVDVEKARADELARQAERIAEIERDISGAGSLESLQTVFAQALDFAKSIQSKEAQQRFIAAKDAKKAGLTPQAA